jgi:hypothetical protein
MHEATQRREVVWEVKPDHVVRQATEAQIERRPCTDCRTAESGDGITSTTAIRPPGQAAAAGTVAGGAVEKVARLPSLTKSYVAGGMLRRKALMPQVTCNTVT